MGTLSGADHDVKQQLETLQWPEHVCFVYDEATDWARAVVRFLKGRVGPCRDMLLPAT